MSMMPGTLGRPARGFSGSAWVGSSGVGTLCDMLALALASESERAMNSTSAADPRRRTRAAFQCVNDRQPDNGAVMVCERRANTLDVIVGNKWPCRIMNENGIWLDGCDRP